MKIVLVVNNKNNRLATVLPKLTTYLSEAEIGDVQTVTTLHQKHAIELARKASNNGCDFLIAVGGDGTLHEVINGILQSDGSATDYPTIGLLPHGSANDFARSAGVANSLEDLVEMIRINSSQKLDLGKIVLHESLKTRYFINIAGVGLGPEVVQKLEGSTSIFGSGFNYFKNIIKGFFNYTKKEVSCTGSNWQWQGKLLQMAVANGRFFGNALCIAPDAKLTDGKFQIAIFGDLSIWDYLKNMGKLKKGVKISHPQVSYHTAEEVVLKSDDACGIEADGEYVGLAPATIILVPKAISFLMPPKNNHN